MSASQGTPIPFSQSGLSGVMQQFMQNVGNPNQNPQQIPTSSVRGPQMPMTVGHFGNGFGGNGFGGMWHGGQPYGLQQAWWQMRNPNQFAAQQMAQQQALRTNQAAVQPYAPPAVAGVQQPVDNTQAPPLYMPGGLS